MSKRAVNGAAVRALREAVGLTQSELAARLGIDKSSLSRIESGKQMANPLLHRKIATELKVSLDAVSLMLPPATDEEAVAA